jgi:SAM-dependent methyltransferase
MASKSRGFRRRLKSAFLGPDWAYRLCLRLRYGAGRVREKPALPLPNGVLQNTAEWKQALAHGKRMHLPLHRSEEKAWDHLAAVFAIVAETTPKARVLDAGAELYSNVLPALFAYGYRDLIGINLDFDVPARRGPIRYLHGDITQTSFDAASFDAACCMSVIEHGVKLEDYFCEMHRILKPGGLLITSTDYYPTSIDARGQSAHGAPVKIFTRSEIEAALRLAQEAGFELTGDVNLDCHEKPVRWAQYNLDYTFAIFTLRKKR